MADNEGSERITSRYRLPIFGGYAAYILAIGTLMFDEMGKTYWTSLGAAVVSIAILDRLFYGQTLSLSVYDIEPDGGIYHQMQRIFWLFMAAGWLVGITLHALGFVDLFDGT